MKDIKKVATAAVKKFGKILIREYQNFDRATIKLKSHHEILTRNDLLSEEIIIKEINNNFPNHKILSEEMGEVGCDSEYLWIIDPIDGTTNFSMHNPLWSISLAVAKANIDTKCPIGHLVSMDIILGVIYAPVLDELYIAELGKGASLNGKKIHVSNIKKGKVLNTFCHGTKPRDIKKALAYYRRQKLAELDCRQMGSAAIELAYVACGRVESFVAPGSNDWDVAAGVLLVQEAGGMVTDFSGRDWRLGVGDIAASNGKVHRDILRMINKK
ncbi:inositol monophosphatase [Candidatus Parcubacteria bacterium]|nr:inositol monophosphatase [Candidatus Parcubacteria bacterium]